MLLETLQAVRKTVGSDYPVLVKMNCRDFVENGLTLEESIQTGNMLEEGGIDAIELSGGFVTTRKVTNGSVKPSKFGPSRVGIHSEEQEAYFQEEAIAFKKEVGVPLILVGGIKSHHVAERLLEKGAADYISMSRPLIREPALINRWKAGDHRKSTCLSDNACFRPAGDGRGVHCVHERKENRD
jgi:2,4-dienoyl-CoA reductase-like NADH-dependent reductase (Old Yellow Enzyme family)